MRGSFKAALFVAISTILISITAPPALADKPKVYKAQIIRLQGNSYEIHVTVVHNDTSWDHYADRWEVIGPGGKILATRVLYHPHIGERSFTRSLRGIRIPKGVTHVIIRAHDKVHGYSRERLIEMPAPGQRETGFK